MTVSPMMRCMMRLQGARAGLPMDGQRCPAVCGTCCRPRIETVTHIMHRVVTPFVLPARALAPRGADEGWWQAAAWRRKTDHADAHTRAAPLTDCFETQLPMHGHTWSGSCMVAASGCMGCAHSTRCLTCSIRWTALRSWAFHLAARASLAGGCNTAVREHQDLQPASSFLRCP